MSDELVTIATYRFAPKADLARALLEQQGIEAFVADATLVTADWLLGGAVGNVKLQVPAAQVAAANALLEQHPHMLDHGPKAEVDGGDMTRCLSCGALMTEHDKVCTECGWSYESAGPASDDSPTE